VIAVYGASGHTGRFVARELRERGRRALLISRRDPAVLAELTGYPEDSCRRATCDEPDELDHSLRGASAVINCAGPFMDTAPALVESALRLGVHYVDVTAEQRTALQTFETYRELARDRRIAILPAMAFYGGLADLLASAITAGARTVDDISIAVALDSWHPTEGTRATGRRNTARRWIVSDGRLAALPDSSPKSEWRFPEPFGIQSVVPVPLSEIITISRHIAARGVASFMNVAPLKDLGDAATPPPKAIDSSGRSSQRFVMETVATCDGERRSIAASGQDIYAVSAPLAVEACIRIVSSPPKAGGTFAPGEIFDPAAFLESLRPAISTSLPEADSASAS
jgi:short subunit dehydrogenase-like uncharacterized protein